MTLSGHFFANYIKIFQKTVIQTVILRCIAGLNLNWIKSYGILIVIMIFFSCLPKSCNKSTRTHYIWFDFWCIRRYNYNYSDALYRVKSVKALIQGQGRRSVSCSKFDSDRLKYVSYIIFFPFSDEFKERSSSGLIHCPGLHSNDSKCRKFHLHWKPILPWICLYVVTKRWCELQPYNSSGNCPKNYWQNQDESKVKS